MLGLCFDARWENLIILYMKSVMYSTILKTPPAIVFTLSLPLILKLGNFYPKASINLKPSAGFNHARRLEEFCILKIFY